VRNEIDRINKTGLFILTGSSSLLDKNIINKLHSGAGRLCKIKMYTLTATEIGFSKKNISFQDLFKGNLKIKKIYNSYTFKNYVELLCKGGRPRVVDKTCTNAMISNAGYLDEISELSDKVTGIQQNSFLKVVSSLARNISQDVTYETLSKDSGLINDVVYKYYEYCKKIFIIEPLETWNVHLRSSASLRVKPKIHFSDTSIAVTAIKGTVEKFIEEPKDFGLFFEDLVIHDLRAYVSISNDFISYYRDSQGLEIDCIIEKRDGS
jgi:predicted AAA+ superfamily ATPase